MHVWQADIQLLHCKVGVVKFEYKDNRLVVIYECYKDKVSKIHKDMSIGGVLSNNNELIN